MTQKELIEQIQTDKSIIFYIFISIKKMINIIYLKVCALQKYSEY